MLKENSERQKIWMIAGYELMGKLMKMPMCFCIDYIMG